MENQINEHLAVRLDGGVSPSLDLLLYDGECTLCRMLADFARQHGKGSRLRFASRQEYLAAHPDLMDVIAQDQLVVLTGDGGMLIGAAAWTFAVEHYPGLDSLQWVARKMGIAPALPTVLRSAGYVYRRWCRHCQK